MSNSSLENTEQQQVLVEGNSEVIVSELISKKWQFVELLGAPVNSETVTGEAIYIRFSDTTSVEGFAGCNRFFGTYTVNNDILTISSVGMTRMYCEGDSLEQKVMNVLNVVETYKVDAKQLEFFSKGNTIAKLEAL